MVVLRAWDAAGGTARAWRGVLLDSTADLVLNQYDTITRGRGAIVIEDLGPPEGVSEHHHYLLHYTIRRVFSPNVEGVLPLAGDLTVAVDPRHHAALLHERHLRTTDNPFTGQSRTSTEVTEIAIRSPNWQRVCQLAETSRAEAALEAADWHKHWDDEDDLDEDEEEPSRFEQLFDRYHNDPVVQEAFRRGDTDEGLGAAVAELGPVRDRVLRVMASDWAGRLVEKYPTRAAVFGGQDGIGSDLYTMMVRGWAVAATVLASRGHPVSAAAADGESFADAAFGLWRELDPDELSDLGFYVYNNFTGYLAVPGAKAGERADADLVDLTAGALLFGVAAALIEAGETTL